MSSGPGPLQKMRSDVAPVMKAGLLRSGLYSILRRTAPSHRIAILRYHAVCPGHAGYASPGICVSPASFQAHVEYLATHYRIVSLPDAVSLLSQGKSLPANAVAITFDDGYADNLGAARTLAAHGATATFYLTAGCLDGGLPFWPAELRHLVADVREPHVTLTAGPERLEIDCGSTAGRDAAVRRLTSAFKANPIPVRENLRDQLRALGRGTPMPRVMLHWEAVREMQALGMTIGSHTMTHPNLPSAGPIDAEREISESKAVLERETGAPVTMFSYPNGGADRYMTPEVARLVKAAGFAAATTSRNAFAGPKSDVFALERVQVSEPLPELAFALEVERFVLQPAPRKGEQP